MVLRLILHTISINNSNIIPNKPCNLCIEQDLGSFMTLLMGLSKGSVPQIESAHKSLALLILCYMYDWWCLLQHVTAENVGIYKPIFVKPMADSIKFGTKLSKSKKQTKIHPPEGEYLSVPKLFEHKKQGEIITMYPFLTDFRTDIQHYLATIICPVQAKFGQNQLENTKHKSIRRPEVCLAGGIFFCFH